LELLASLKSGRMELNAKSVESAMNEPRLTIEENNDPCHSEKMRAQHARALRNCEWLSAHWSDLLPAARGRFVAVAGQQAFVADTSAEAWALAKAACPEDDGAIMQYVRKDTNPRIYANRGALVSV
jgi:hypothetical protein